MRFLSLVGWACLLAWLVVLGWWAHEATTATQTQREAFLRERWELAEARAAECERLCAADRELAERAAALVRDTWTALGLEGR